VSDTREALLYLDLDKGVADVGPLFEEPRRRLEADPALRAGWQQFQALRALAWEAAPEPGERLIRQALTESRRERVKAQLARSTGSEDLAREILLGQRRERSGLPFWAWVLVLLAGAGAAWLLLGPQIQALIAPERSPLLAERPAPVLTPGQEAPLAFEFPAQASPAQAALAAPKDGVPDSEDVKQEVPAAKQARRLLREHLQAQREPTPAPTPMPTAPQRRPAPQKPQPVMVAALPKPTAVPTAVPTPMPTPVPTAIPTAVPTARPAFPTPVPKQSGPAPSEASFSLEGPSVKQGGSLGLSLGLPERKDVDLRLFDQRGRPVRSIHSGDLGPGSIELSLEAKDELGKALAPGTYYLRVMTAWFSRVEPVEVTGQGGN
jgi:hypothetical protein